jgi:hypothetical protein
LINQIFEIEKKVLQINEPNSIYRNVNRLKEIIGNDLLKTQDTERPICISYHNPLGEDFSDTRTDCEANIAGTDTENLEIVEVIRPIIYYSYNDNDKQIKGIVQKAVVVVKSKNI